VLHVQKTQYYYRTNWALCEHLIFCFLQKEKNHFFTPRNGRNLRQKSWNRGFCDFLCQKNFSVISF